MFFNLILPFIEGVIYYQPISLILLTPPPAPPLQGRGELQPPLPVDEIDFLKVDSSPNPRYRCAKIVQIERNTK